MGDINLVAGDNQLNVVLTPSIVPTATLFGTVTDESTGYPLNGVAVTVSGLVRYTDAYGNYRFEGLAPGSYVVTFEKEGYETETR